MGDPARLWERQNGVRVTLAHDVLQRALGTSLTVPTATPILGSPSNDVSPAAGGHTPTPSSTLGSPFAYRGTYGRTTPSSTLPRYEHRTTTASPRPSTLGGSSAPASTIQRYPTRRPSPSGWYSRPPGANDHSTEPSPAAPRPARIATTHHSPSPSRTFRLRPSPVLAARHLRTPPPFRPRPVPALPSQHGSPTSDPFRLRPSPTLPRAFVFTTSNTTAYESDSDRAFARSQLRSRLPPRRVPHTPQRQITGAAQRGWSSGYTGYGHGHGYGGPTYSYGGGDGSIIHFGPHQCSLTGHLGRDMASSPSQVPPPQLWPDFSLSWLNNQIRPRKSEIRRFTEIGIHDSDSDDYRHLSIAVATKAMKEMGQHIVVHSRVNADETEFIGSEAYEEYIRLDNELLRASYKKPVPARTPLILGDDETVLVV
ncbi:predicted protein [Chaetomium globosum CBS 148.51]|uniref:Uncharacterized protein n=1 Tax=Chaetomium globosum (strain ATCC 6205 / CBS 148.51 / DSM 1962 / NBRC 6347 / NRRL 1970) TaxID=306901 RepID=Q2H3U7_CHAGB|nr:uncharacterized protein CHGG_06668 [Chaetomium globosum CBS 148.51]EAQ90049.1 predicted protein [Chaetomium globosum CBS 148.51]